MECQPDRQLQIHLRFRRFARRDRQFGDKNERKFRIGQLAINDMKIGPANRAGINANE